MDEVTRSQLLTQEADRHLGDRQRVERVHADPGRGRGVRLFALEGDVEVVDREAEGVESLGGEGVNHHRGVHVIEVARVDEVDLAAAAFLGRSAEQGDREVQLVGDGPQTDGGSEGRRGDDVVAAGVADVGQRVELRAVHDVQVAVAHRGAKGGGKIGDAALDAKAARPRPTSATAKELSNST